MTHGFVITANALIEGDVVWLTTAGTLTRRLEEAEVFTSREQAETALATANSRSAELVGCYVADTRMTPNGPAPAHFREGFRARGPSNYPHGKQAETGTEPHVSL